MRPMKERNQVTVGLVGTAIAAVLVLLAINLGNLPFVNPTNDYHADFANAAGLKNGDDVRVLGIPVGKVEGIHVQGGHVRVDFTVKDSIKLGDESHASIEVATVLGNLFVQIESAGSGTLHDGGTIPLSRTSVPFTLLGAFQTFAQFSRNTNNRELATSLRALADAVAGIAPADSKAALRGLTRMAQTLAAKQDQISSILDASTTIVDTLNQKSTALVQLVLEGDEFLKLVEQRRAIISALLRDTAALGQQLQALIDRNGAHLAGLVSNVKAIAALLAKDRAKLQQAVTVLGQFSVNIANATGSGPWLDLYAATDVNPDNQIRACGPHPDSSKRPCGD
jgi:phospholipid/cholesterol/gamma-HCH transport system substrate-binding protein